MTRLRTVGLIAVVLLSMAPRPSVSISTQALYSASRTSTPHIFKGAIFSPGIAPTPTRTTRGVNNSLQWSEVTINSAVVVSYVVTRVLTDGSTSQVCTGVDAPVTSGGIVSCNDRKPPSGARYSEQPYVSVNNQTTWSLAVSALSQ